MIKRLIDIARASFHSLGGKNAEENTSAESTPESDLGAGDREWQAPPRPAPPEDPLAGYYANLEISPGSDREAVKAAWKRMMKKYHPDLHDNDPEKRKTADELTRRLTESYRILDKELSKRR